ncbi:hypothetical protein H7F53_13370, partial [Novosphingobium piscinae]|nr:hypothetical protein [Novosphingobium piscinae]
MSRAGWLMGTALAISSALAMAQDAPESLLPPGFDRPAPRPSRAPAAPAPAAAAPAPARPAAAP